MKRKILYVICGLMVIGTIYEITKTYAVFSSDNQLYVHSDIAKWNIYVNGSHINLKDNFIVSDNSRVADKRIAPGTSGYFDIVIDPSDTQVAFRYDLTFDFSKLGSNFAIEKIEETQGIDVIKTGENTFSNIITLDDINSGVTNNIRVYIKWTNSEDENEGDSAIGLLKNNTIKIPVMVMATQYFNEELVPYVEEEIS
ncbi:MAG: hypothetical protein Q4C38_02620 [bacterium]|nr:hypothetical protein [bacterium]